MMVILDVEANGLQPDRIWCVSVKEVSTGKVRTFTDPDSLSLYLDSVLCVVGHNCIWYDLPVLSDVWGIDIDESKVIDTLVVSRMVNFARKGGHSVEAYGKDFGMQKKFISGWNDESKLPQYIERCEYDVEIQKRILDSLSRFIYDKEWSRSIRMEHELAFICRKMRDRGFKFNKEEADRLLLSVQGEMDRLEREIREEIPAVIKPGKSIKLRSTVRGDLYSNLVEYVGGEDVSFTPDEEFYRFEYEDFNPGSPKHRIDFFWRCGWKPFEKTKGHKQCERKLRALRMRKGRFKAKVDEEIETLEARMENYATYGWTTSEGNLSTLPDDAPSAAKKIATWLCLDGRRGDLVEWISSYVPYTGRVHGTINPIGAWTHRASHKAPNTGNIVSSFVLDDIRGDSPSPVELVKLNYDSRLRSLWCSEKFLVGTDADSIQLRIAAHYIKDKEYTNAVAYGDKSLGTDVHSVNCRKLGQACSGRSVAKTFIYAWFLGAGTGEVSRILSCSQKVARDAVLSFVSSTPGLAVLKSDTIPRDARRGFFTGLDGRKVICSSEHLMLAGYLQNGEKVIMGHANVRWQKEAKAEGIRFNQVAWVHDEWQTEAYTMEEAKRLGEIQCEAIEWVGNELGIECPLSGTYDIGTNWLETH